MTIKEYEAVNAMRVSEIVKLGTRDIGSIIKDKIKEQEQTDAIRLGLVTHSLLLRKDREGIPEDIAIIDFENYRSKDAQNAKQEAIENDKIPILIKEYDNIANGLEKAKKELNEYFNPEECDFEQSFFAEDEFFGKIKGRVDCIQNGSVINDLKVTTQTNMLDKKIFDFGYQLQMYIYMKLANLTSSNLVFYNPETYLVYVKHLHLNVIEQECLSLLERAKYNFELLTKYDNGEMGVVSKNDYVTPQWAFTYLMEN